MWISKISPKILYGSEIFPVGEKEIKTQRKTARAIIGAPVNTSSLALFEFLGWLRVEKMADKRCLHFAIRLKSSPHPLIREAFELSRKINTTWSLRFSKILHDNNLEAAWDSIPDNPAPEEISEWVTVSTNAIHVMEQQEWTKVLQISSPNTVGKGSSLITSGQGISAKSSFFFRYSYPCHYLRRGMIHFDSSCALCGHPSGTPSHLLFECNASLCSQAHKQRFLECTADLKSLLQKHPNPPFEARILSHWFRGYRSHRCHQSSTILRCNP